MKRHEKHNLWGGLVLLGLFAVRPGYPAFLPEAAALNRAAWAEPGQNPELDQFFKAKSLVFEQDWTGTRSGMEGYLREYPFGKMRDEALYWLARSLDRLSRRETEKAKVIELKTKAFETLDRVVKEFPSSLWRDDARELQVLIAGEMAILGVPSQLKFVEDATKATGKSEAELRRVALDALAGLAPQTAIPALRNFIETEEDPGLRKHGVRLLGSRYTREVAGKDPDQEVRREAEYWLEKIRVRLIPVQLNYYCYGARLDAPLEYSKVPEGEVVVFPVPHGKPGSSSRAWRAIQRVFNGRVSLAGGMATSKGGTDIFDSMEAAEGVMITTSHKLSGFRVGLDRASIKKTPETVEGRVHFDDLISPFKVDGRNDALLAARRGDRLAVMYLEMSPKDIEDLDSTDDEESLSGLLSAVQSIATAFRGKPKKPVYYTKDVRRGFVVHTTLNSGPVSSTRGVQDYSLAKAEIPGPGGTWVLTGHILLVQDERVLVARMGKLIRPDGKTAAAGEEIRVPVDDPAAFTPGGKKPDSAKSALPAPQAADPKFPVSFGLEGGGIIHSSRTQFRLDEMKTAIVEFGPSKALLPGPGGTWTLTGRLVLLRDVGSILVRDGALVNPEGKTVAEGAVLKVPVKNPEQYMSVKEHSE